jgi:F-type H+-transporting ATPase subunit b
MRRSQVKLLLAVGCLSLFLAGIAAAQETTEPPANAQTAGQTNGGGGSANAGVAHILHETTEESAHSAGKWGDKLGLSKGVSFGISVALNFLGIIVFFWLITKSALPQMFRERTAAIQKGIRDAQAASADASRRLTEIEARLGKLDAEVATIRQAAEREASAEEERVRQAAEHDQQRIIAGAEAEIEAMTRNAQRELKGYAASLAIDLAARGIRVDESTDQQLVRGFVGQLGKGGQ